MGRARRGLTDMLSIIVLSMDGGKWIKKMLYPSLMKHPPEVEWELIVVNNGSPETDYIDSIADQRVHLSRNVGYSIGCTIGAHLAEYSYLAFMNDDIEFTEDIYTPMLETMRYEDDVGLCSTGVDDMSFGTWYYARLDWACSTTPVFETNQSPLYELQKSEYVPIFLMPKHVFWEVGGFDTRFTPFNYEDADLCFKLRKAGYRILVHTQLSVKHVGSASRAAWRGKSADEWMVRNQKQFYEKWGSHDAY